MANGDGTTPPTDATATTDVAPLPKDVAWRRLATAALTWDPGEWKLSAPLVAGTLRPSVTVFGSKVPREETREEFPGERIVLLKVAVTLTGMRPPSHLMQAPGGVGLFPFKSELAPCIGAVVEIRLGDADQPGAPGGKIYIRDLYPRRQESTVNEIIGSETFTRASSSVSTTKSWNVSGSVTGGVNLGVASLSSTASGGYSQSKTTQNERERSQKNSRETHVESIYHVLTAYHLGRNKATFTIQPRPFEGENWELLGGFRKVEGIQEFMLIAAMPYDLERLAIQAEVAPGFRARTRLLSWDDGILPFPGWNKRYFWNRVGKTSEVWKELEDDGDDNSAWTLFYPPSFPRVEGRLRKGDRGEEWTGWMEDYKLYLEVKKFVDDQLWVPQVLVSKFAAQTTLRLHMGSPCEEMVKSDPCNGGPPPYHDVLPDQPQPLQFQDQGFTDFHDAAGTQATQVARVWEADVPAIGQFGTDRTGQLATANLHMANLFDAVLAGASAEPTAFRPLAETNFATRLRASAVAPAADVSRTGVQAAATAQEPRSAEPPDQAASADAELTSTGGTVSGGTGGTTKAGG